MDTNQTIGSTPTENQTQRSGGSSLPIIIVILIIALGGIYFWYTRPVVNNTNVEVIADEDLNKELENSVELDISADLDSIDTDFK